MQYAVLAIVLIAGLFLNSCTDKNKPSDPIDEASDNSPATSIRTASPVDESKPEDGQSSSAQEKGAAVPGAGPVLVTFRDPNPILADAERQGRITLERGCVIFTESGSAKRYTAVFAKPASIVDGRDGAIAIRAAGQIIPIGQEVIFGGGAIPDSEADGAGKAKAGQCPQNYYAIGELR